MNDTAAQDHGQGDDAADATSTLELTTGRRPTTEAIT
jgi:hypothetical protein